MRPRITLNVQARWQAALVCLGLGASLAQGCPNLLDYRTRTLAGEPKHLCAFEGKVLLVVNTASYCGFTSQYEGLEALYQTYRERGLVVLGFPANDFGKQEPGSNQEVADFCERTFKVRFPMFEKTVVVGDGANAFYRNLKAATGQAPRWNFHKYLIDKDGKAVQSFASAVRPDATEITQAIERLLTSPVKR